MGSEATANLEREYSPTRLDSASPIRHVTRADIGSPARWYTASWTDASVAIDVDCGRGTTIRVELPDPPPVEDMVNYGLSEHQSIFRRTALPQMIRKWPKALQDAYIEREWHRRRNGLWIVIKDRPIYLTGPAYTFFNYWQLSSGGLPTFRMEAVEFFLIWMQVIRDPVHIGMQILKPRRLGETEKVGFIMWELGSRVRGSWCGQQNKTETEAGINFARMVKSVNRLPWFFRPIIDGPVVPKRKLRMAYPSKFQSRKSLRATGEEETAYIFENLRQELGSTWDFRPGNAESYDGMKLRVYYGDEFGKWQGMNCNETHNIVKWCVLEQVTRKVGLMIYTSTIENFESAETLENARTFWNGSDPDVLDERGATKNQLIRVLRTARLNAETDRWGFHKSDELEKYLLAKRKQLLDSGDYDGYSSLVRKQPLSISDVWTLDAKDSVLNPGVLDARREELDRDRDMNGEPIRFSPRRYTLNWTEGRFGTKVEAILDPNGRWEITQHPIRPNHQQQEGAQLGPGNTELYATGCDPIDHHKGTRGSEYAMAVFAKWNPGVDRDIKLDTNLKPLPTEVPRMRSDQFVCTYTARPLDPRECWEDSLKTAIYYGSQVLFENNKPGAGNWMVYENGGRFAHYAAGKTDAERIRSSASASPSPGQASVAPVIQDYVASLLHHITHRREAIYFLSLIQDWRKFNAKTRTKCDLAVASGFALMLAYDDLASIVAERKNRWAEIEPISYTNRRQVGQAPNWATRLDERSGGGGGQNATDQREGRQRQARERDLSELTKLGFVD